MHVEGPKYEQKHCRASRPGTPPPRVRSTSCTWQTSGEAGRGARCRATGKSLQTVHGQMRYARGGRRPFPCDLPRMACPYARIEQGLEPRLAETQNGGKRLMRGDIHSIFRSKKQVSRVIQAS